MAVKKDKYDVLADVVAALRDQNKKVVIETLDAQDTGWAFAYYGDNVPYIPTKRARTTMNGVISLAVLHAKSIKIGRDISIKRIHRKPTVVKTEKQEYEVDNGWYYVVRTPKGEAKFERGDDDFMAVWGYALSMYDGTENYMNFYRRLRNEKLKKIAGGPAVLKDEKANKFNESVKRLKALGVDPKGLVDYIQKKMGKNI